MGSHNAKMKQKSMQEYTREKITSGNHMKTPMCYKMDRHAAMVSCNYQTLDH